MKPLSKSKRYSSFIIKRNQALEELYNKAQAKINDQLRKAFTHVSQIIISQYAMMNNPGNQFLSHGPIKNIEHQIQTVFDQIAFEIYRIIIDLRHSSYVLSHVGEAEAIGRVLGKDTKVDLNREKLDRKKYRELEAQEINPLAKIKHSLTKIKRNLLNSLEYSIIAEETQEEMMARLLRAFPKHRSVGTVNKKRIRHLKVKEADKSEKARDRVKFGFGTSDREEYEKMYNDYKEKFVPKWRGPDSLVEPSKGKPTSDDWYVWELERDTNYTFVLSVREGQIDAAKENGITEFVWITLVSENTCPSCIWRDGLTTKEIESQLIKAHKDDEWPDAVTPPAHYNCNCDLAPVTDDLPDIPASNEKEFDEWLKSKEEQ